MRIIYDRRHQRHRPQTEILYGKPTPHPDQPERVEAIHEALVAGRWRAALIGPQAYPAELAASIHEPDYLEHLRERCAEVAQAGADEEWFPYVWPRDRGMDTGTPVRAETFDLAWASACVALTGADLLLAEEGWAFALCRPPGHHAAPGALGGYCYLNNAALAAERLLSRGARSRGRGVAILDLDIHHGNGTQAAFLDSAEVLYCSIHGEPEWAYPPHTGFAGEVGEGAGRGYTYNQPLPEGTAWTEYGAALDRALSRIAAFAPAYVVLSQGFDTYEGDRWGGFRLHADDFGRIGERLGALGRPVLVVLEGGYEPANLAAGALALLDGLAARPVAGTAG